MSAPLIRILSDLHYGDRASKVKSLSQLDPLFVGATTVVLNGDTLDTRESPHPEATALQRAEVNTYFSKLNADVIFLTGNHDPDFTEIHAREFVGGQIFVTHGDVLYDNIVPWSSEASLLHGRVKLGQEKWTEVETRSLETRLALFRRVCASLPQRHQAERNGLKYLISYLNDTVWPPTRVLSMFRAWDRAPELAAALAREHRPNAKFILLGHLHRPGIWKTRDGKIVVNTGSFCPPFGGYAVDLTPGKLTVRKLEARTGAFHLGRTLAEFALAHPTVLAHNNAMSMEFGWWHKDPEQGKFQILARVHGGNIEWTRKQGHHSPWEVHPATEEDWDRLMDEANRRVPRRLLSPKQFEDIKRLRPR